MKKLLLGLLSCTLMIGCGRANLSTNYPVIENIYTQNDAGNQISMYSEEGLKKFYSLLVSHVFKFADKNRDNRVNYDEFKSFYFYVVNGNVIIINPPGNDPGPIPSPHPSGSPTPDLANFDSSAKDSFQDFLKVDKNKDGKITLSEAQANYHFLGANQNKVRKGLAKFIFNQIDSNKNKSVTKEEYKRNYLASFDPETQNRLMALYFASDKNLDGKLGFSEFEDLVYASVKAGWEFPAPGQTSIPCSPHTCR